MVFHGGFLDVFGFVSCLRSLVRVSVADSEIRSLTCFFLLFLVDSVWE